MSGFHVSPQINIFQLDNNQAVPLLPSSGVGAMAGYAKWGPAAIRTLMTGQPHQHSNLFFKPDDDTYLSWFVAEDFLQYSKALWFYRVVGKNARNSVDEQSVVDYPTVDCTDSIDEVTISNDFYWEQLPPGTEPPIYVAVNGTITRTNVDKFTLPALVNANGVSYVGGTAFQYKNKSFLPLQFSTWVQRVGGADYSAPTQSNNFLQNPTFTNDVGGTDRRGWACCFSGGKPLLYSPIGVTTDNVNYTIPFVDFHDPLQIRMETMIDAAEGDEWIIFESSTGKTKIGVVTIYDLIQGYVTGLFDSFAGETYNFVGRFSRGTYTGTQSDIINVEILPDSGQIPPRQGTDAVWTSDGRYLGLTTESDTSSTVKIYLLDTDTLGLVEHDVYPITAGLSASPYFSRDELTFIYYGGAAGVPLLQIKKKVGSHWTSDRPVIGYTFTNLILNVGLTPDNQYLFVISTDLVIRFFKLIGTNYLYQSSIVLPTGPYFYYASWSPDGEQLALLNAASVVEVYWWNPDSPTLIGTYDVKDVGVTGFIVEENRFYWDNNSTQFLMSSYQQISPSVYKSKIISIYNNGGTLAPVTIRESTSANWLISARLDLSVVAVIDSNHAELSGFTYIPSLQFEESASLTQPLLHPIYSYGGVVEINPFYGMVAVADLSEIGVTLYDLTFV